MTGPADTATAGTGRRCPTCHHRLEAGPCTCSRLPVGHLPGELGVLHRDGCPLTTGQAVQVRDDLAGYTVHDLNRLPFGEIGADLCDVCIPMNVPD
jgi:hypothetical protein